MRKYIVKVILSLLIIYTISYYLPFVVIFNLPGVFYFMVLLSVLNLILKPLLIIITIPVTIFTLGLFLFVLNAIIIMVADYFIGGIHIGNGLPGAFIFSIIFSISNYFIEILLKES